MNKLFIKFISWLVIFSFLSQDVLRADMLARDSKRDICEIEKTLKDHPGAGDSEWKDFKEDEDGFGMPFNINISPEIERALKKRYKKLRPIRGDIVEKSNEMQVVFGLEGKHMNAVKKRLNKNQDVLRVFGAGTRIIINPSANRPVFFNKGDNTLDIHGAMLLSLVSDELLSFCLWHDARHRLIDGLSPLMEELLNIYMDFEYLDALAKKDPVGAVRLIRGLEDIEGAYGNGYSGILIRRAQRKSDNYREHEEFFKDILKYLLYNCDWAVKKVSFSDGMNDDDKLEIVKGLITEEINNVNSCLNIFIRGGRHIYEDFPERLSPNIAKLIPQTSAFLFPRIDFFARFKNETNILDEECRKGPVSKGFISEKLGVNPGWTEGLLEYATAALDICRVYSGENGGNIEFIHKEKAEELARQRVLVKGFDFNKREYIYVRIENHEEEWATGYIRNRKVNGLLEELRKTIHNNPPLGDFGKEEFIKFIETIWKIALKDNGMFNPAFGGTNKARIEYQLETAVRMAKEGVSQIAVAAALIHEMDMEDFEKIARPYIQRTHRNAIIELIISYRRIKEVLKYEFYPSRHVMQNILYLVIQLTRGNSETLMLAMMSELEYLRYLSENHSKYDEMTPREKIILQQAFEFVYIPLAEALGMMDWANTMKGLYIKMILGNDYVLAEEEPSMLLGVKKSYNELDGIKDRIIGIVMEEIKGLNIPVRIRGRVKTIYSVYNKSRDIKDTIGIQLILTGRFSQKDKNRLLAKLDKLFALREPDMKRFKDKKYNYYDFIARIEYGRCRGFDRLLQDLGVKGLDLELQVYPSEDDLKRYQYGTNAHWLYKLESLLKEKDTAERIPQQVFDRDVLEKIYTRLKEKDFNRNLQVFYEELKIRGWKAIGIVNEGKLAVVRTVRTDIAPDVVSEPGLDGFGRDYLGLRGLGEKLCIPNIYSGQLIPDIYEIVNAEKPEKRLKERELKAIKETAKRPRAYFNASKLLGMRPNSSTGKDLFDNCLTEIVGGIKREYLERTVFSLLDKDFRDVGLVYKALSLKNMDEFYGLIDLVNKDSNNKMLKELIRISYFYMTGEGIGEEIDVKELRKKWGIKDSLPDAALLIYIFTIAECGKKYLMDSDINPQDKKDEMRLSVIMTEFGLQELRQLYSRIWVKKVLATVVKLRLKSVRPPYISIKIKAGSDSKRNEDIEDIINRSGWDIYSRKQTANEIKLSIRPEKYWLDKMDIFLQEIRAIDGVANAELIQEEPFYPISRLNLVTEDRISINEMMDSINDLLGKLGISMIRDGEFNMRDETHKAIKFRMRMHGRITTKELEDAIREWLIEKFDGKISIQRLDVGIVDKRPPPAGLTAILLLFIPYLSGFAGSFGIIDLVFLLVVSMGFFCYLWLKYDKDTENAINARIQELKDIWKGYDEEDYSDEKTPLLDTFFTKLSEAPAAVDFGEVLRNLEITTAAGVVETVNEPGHPEAKDHFQGYLIFGRYDKKQYKFFAPAELKSQWTDIAYEYRDREYISVGSDVFTLREEELQRKVEEFIAKRNGNIKKLKRTVMSPTSDRAALEEFCRNNVLFKSVLRRFPVSDNPLPSFNHNIYVLSENDSGMHARYFPIRFFEGYISGHGRISANMSVFTTGVFSLHELCHAIFDYSSDSRNRILEHFRKFPNNRLMDTIAEDYGYDRTNPDHTSGLTNETFAYTLSEFCCMSMPWRDIKALQAMRKSMDEKTPDELISGIIKMIEVEIRGCGESSKYFTVRIKRSLEEALDCAKGSYGDWRRGEITEEELRDIFFEAAKKTCELSTLPLIRLLDVRFFAETGLIEPWMNPLELGFSAAEVNDPDNFIHEKYYSLLINFLVMRSKQDDNYHKLYNGKWVKAPYGADSLDMARRLMWGLVKVEYGITNLSDLEGYEEMNELGFWILGMVTYMMREMAEEETGEYVIEKIRRFINNIKKMQKRKIQLRKFAGYLRDRREKAVRILFNKDPWLMQAFCEQVILEKPKILILDADIIDKLSISNQRKLSHIINQVKNNKGKIVIVSKAGFNEDRFRHIFGQNIDLSYIQGDKPIKKFAGYVYGDIRNRFKIEEDNIAVYTTRDGFNAFRELWNKFIIKGLLYIMDKDRVYITKEELRALQDFTGESTITVRYGDSVDELRLMPEEMYKEVVLDELGRRTQDRGA